MSPQVFAAVIAASVSFLTLIGTLAAQHFGRRATSRDTQKALEEQSKQLDRTLAEQYARTLNERFATAAGMMGIDKPAAVRLAGVYAMAGLADDWEDNRQTCIDVLCGYLRIPYYADDPDDSEEHLHFLTDREVRHTVVRVITAHLREDAKVSWCGADLDFTGVVFDRGDFSEAEFSGGIVSFAGAEFPRGHVSFAGARFSGGTVSFIDARFSGGVVDFMGARFSSGMVSFGDARFSSGTVSFIDARFSGGAVDFMGARFSGGTVSFWGAADWSHPPEFDWEGTPPSGLKLPVGGS